MSEDQEVMKIAKEVWKKKIKAGKEIVLQMETVKKTESISYKDQCKANRIAPSTFYRWKDNVRRGREAVSTPGPHKAQPLDADGLNERIRGLKHGRSRSAGAGHVHDQYRHQISRRNLNVLIKRARKDKNAEYTHIKWNKPGLAWGMDDAQYRSKITGERFFLHTVQEMSSRYKFKPLVDTVIAAGPAVAQNLEQLFDEHGAPLFIKRDNGSNLNHQQVDQLLAERCVIPLNSPVYYPQYNGSVERTQRELKGWIAQRPPENLREACIHGELAAIDLNHKKRRVLNGKTSCWIFNKEPRTRYSKYKRKEIYDWITEMALCIIQKEESQITMPAAWRTAIEIWLRKHGYVTVTNRRKCYPLFT